MTRSTKRRIDVMISSTSNDLEELRKRASDAIVRLQWTPLAMELDSAIAGKNAITYSLDLVDNAEVYLGIFGVRYGFRPVDAERNPKNLAITELEYRRAKERGIPILIFIMHDSYPLPISMTTREKDDDKLQLARLIDELTTEHIVGFFKSPDDFHLQAYQALNELKHGNTLEIEGDGYAHESTQIPPVQETGNVDVKQKLTSAQIKAAHAPSRLVSLIAPPGTGKSFVIEERVRWLLSQNVPPDAIAVVSFTRAASRDLKDRIIKHCEKSGIDDADEVSVTTLHSLAMKVLRKAKLLQHYPCDPQVLDAWEIKNIFDAEFSEAKRHTLTGLENLTLGRAAEVREAWDAYWNTGNWNPPNYIQPTEPITEIEKSAFQAFHTPTTQVYSCVLPGEIVKMCTDKVLAGLLDPVGLLGIQHLIVDEVQDLNYTDMQFINVFADNSVNVYMAGDYDQSIYSFRYAFPTGMQEFLSNHSSASKYRLNECFRCSPAILTTARELIAPYSVREHSEEAPFSFCQQLRPQLLGTVQRWAFRSDKAEYEAIAQSCQSLIKQGINPRNILILISNTRALLSGKPSDLQQAFDRLNIPVEMPRNVRYIDEPSGRFIYAIIRIACDNALQDYIAHRTLLGSLKRVGTKVINGIREKIVSNNLNYLKIFYEFLPPQLFSATELSAINRLANICSKLQSWQSDDLLNSKISEIETLLNDNFSSDAVEEFLKQSRDLPSEITINEFKQLLATDNSEQKEKILETIYQRLDLPIPSGGVLPQQVRVMTMHGAKGLNADIVFIPGLEEDILPGAKRKEYYGLIQEAARQLYVSITRARIACFVSFARSRVRNGKYEYGRVPSQFCGHLSGSFTSRDIGLSEAEAREIVADKALFTKHMFTRRQAIE